MRPRSGKWTQEEIESAVSARREGAKPLAIARSLGCKTQRVKNKLSDLGVVAVAWTRKAEQLAVWWRRQGVKSAVIARRLGRTEYSVKNKLHRLGVVVEPEKRPKRKRGTLLRAVTRDLLTGGTQLCEIAEARGVDCSYVSRVRKRLGIAPATAGERLSRSWVLRKQMGHKPPNRWSKK
jgi:hypothetical protein